MKALAVALIVVFIAGIVGTYFFWPANKDQRATAFFSLLQFVAAFALVLLTFLYLATAQKQLADQNRAPVINVTRHDYPQIAPFVMRLVVEMVNPSARTTSIGIKGVRVGQEDVVEFHFLLDQASRDKVTIPARDLLYVLVNATFDGIPIWSTQRQTKEVVTLTFEDVFHGRLRPITYQL